MRHYNTVLTSQYYYYNTMQYNSIVTVIYNITTPLILDECNVLCGIDYPDDWAGTTTLPDIEACPPSCPYCAFGGTTPPPGTVVYYRCFQYPPPVHVLFNN